jgi:hypothetical protein
MGVKMMAVYVISGLSTNGKTMTITLESYTIPKQGMVHLQVSRSFEIKITDEEARRQVNRWVHNEVSYLMRGLPPTLVVGEQVVWRVPVSIGFPRLGQMGIVGMVEVDVEIGTMNTSPDLQAQLIREAEKIADRLPPYQPRQTASTAYLAKHLSPASEAGIH